jgi:hypothetical protein
MAVNYNDKRFTAVTEEEQNELNKNDELYEGMIKDNDDAIQDLIENSKESAEVLKEEQNKQTQHQIDTIEQQKEQSQKDYIKEQSGSYVDWQKESSKYGANAERMADAGLTGSGYHESTQVSLYNTYQNRVAVARDAFERAKLNYDNAIKEAQLQNSSKLAEIALQANQEQLQLALEGIQYKNNLLLDKANARMQIKSLYYSKWQDVLNQINTENALAEEQRQFNASLSEEQRQFDAQQGEYEYTDGGDNTITTDYFSGTIPSDTLQASQKYGTFSNGYQPKGITGHGTLKKTGDTVDVRTTTLNGQNRTIEQNIWKAEDGTLWYWEGREMKYKKYGTARSGAGGKF